jgi:thiosulfate/3-mercaptopyruvate sulfurtransferase
MRILLLNGFNSIMIKTIIMNKSRMIFVSLFVIAFIAVAFQRISIKKGNEPWIQQQLLEPADLAKILNDANSLQPTVYSIGPLAIIKNSIDIGSAGEKDNLKKLEQDLGKLPKDANIVIYCGCCPFNKCPNIRPAFTLLNEMGFKNHKLLNMPQNIKVDWIDHGYPVNQ